MNNPIKKSLFIFIINKDHLLFISINDETIRIDSDLNRYF